MRPVLELMKEDALYVGRSLCLRLVVAGLVAYCMVLTGFYLHTCL